MKLQNSKSIATEELVKKVIAVIENDELREKIMGHLQKVEPTFCNLGKDFIRWDIATTIGIDPHNSSMLEFFENEDNVEVKLPYKPSQIAQICAGSMLYTYIIGFLIGAEGIAKQHSIECSMLSKIGV